MKIILPLIALLIFSSCLLQSTPVSLANQTFQLEIAKTSSQKTRGLSHRSSLCSTCGMIFVFDQEGIYPFWMKDTLLPLDIAWLNQNGEIVTLVTAQPQPNTDDQNLTVYPNLQPAKYVIEVNAGTFSKLNLKVGDTLTLPKL